MKIRPGSERDVEALVHFNRAMALETEGRELDRLTLEGGVRGLLNQSGYGFYLVAESDDGEIAGGLMVTFEWSDWRNGCFWWIQSVYVMPAFRRQGIYRDLYGYVRKMAEERGGVCGFRLYVEKDNVSAKKTYRKLGMEECDYRMFEGM